MSRRYRYDPGQRGQRQRPGCPWLYAGQWHEIDTLRLVLDRDGRHHSTAHIRQVRAHARLPTSKPVVAPAPLVAARVPAAPATAATCAVGHKPAVNHPCNVLIQPSVPKRGRRWTTQNSDAHPTPDFGKHRVHVSAIIGSTGNTTRTDTTPAVRRWSSRWPKRSLGSEAIRWLSLERGSLAYLWMLGSW